MRPVVFVKYFDKGSTVLGAEQMIGALAEHGVESRSLYADELDGIADSILIFIKTSKLPHLLAARRRHNLLVLDVQDTLALKKRLKNRRLFHGIIFRSQKPLDDYGTGDERSVKIYLQWNPRYQPNRIGDREFRLGYLGDPRSFQFWDALPDVPCVPEQRFWEDAPNFNCHISIRSVRREFDYKPTCKVSTAAACHANLITTPDPASVEILGSDYPYYCEPDRDSILRAIEHARETFAGPVWQAGLEKMREIRESHRLEAIARQYVAYLSRLSGASGPAG